MKIAVILPAYNEELTIGQTIADFYVNIPDVEIWVINNCSTDNTFKIATETLSELDCKGGVLNELRPGKGNAVRRAFLEIEADYYVLADADMTYPARFSSELIRPVVQGYADMSVGDRISNGSYHSKNRRLFHGFGNDLVKNSINFLFNAKIVDVMSGYRVFSRAFVKTYPILVEGFQLETDMTLHALDKRLRICEIPIDYQDRPLGSFSKLSTCKDGLRVLSTIGRILRYYKPLLFFSLAGLFSFFLGLIAGAPVIMEWIQTRIINHIPLAILATGLMIISAIAFAMGIFLDSIAHQNRIKFELDLLQSPR